jgi:hypothetical protein
MLITYILLYNFAYSKRHDCISCAKRHDCISCVKRHDCISCAKRHDCISCAKRHSSAMIVSHVSITIQSLASSALCQSPFKRHSSAIQAPFKRLVSITIQSLASSANRYNSLLQINNLQSINL